MSLTQLAARLHSVVLARLLLALLLLCNLTLCIGGHGVSLGSISSQTNSLAHNMAMADSESLDTMALMDHQAPAQTLSCHQGQGDEVAMNGDCKMQAGVSGAATALPLLGMLISLVILPLLLFPYLGATRHRLDLWLRDPFLRSRGAHPPSWPRRHLMLSVLRH